VKNITRSPYVIKFITDPIKNELDRFPIPPGFEFNRFPVPPGFEFKLRFPFKNFEYSKNKSKFRKKNYWAVPIDDEQNYFYLPSYAQDENGDEVKGTQGAVLKLITQ